MRSMQTIGQLIRERRTAAGLTLRVVAASVGLSVPYLSDVELGHRVPVVGRWLAFSRAIPGLSVKDMATAAVATGPVEIDARDFRASQRDPIVAALVRMAEAGS